jgi:hypothetical protein
MFGTVDRLRTFHHTPVQALDPGPDGIVKGDDLITVWETACLRMRPTAT